jgi:hypothetical protein
MNFSFTEYFQSCANLIGLNAITKYSEIKNKINKYAKSIYTYHPWITYSIDISIYGCNWIYAMHYNENIEPYHNCWISSNKLIQPNFYKDSNMLNIIDKHTCVYDNNHISCSYTFIRFLNNYNSVFKPQFTSLYKENLLYAKYNNIYISRVQHDRTFDEFKHIDGFNTPSTVGFLYVTVKTNDQNINMDIDQNHMYVNNELFSTAFIHRYIKYNNIDAICNNNYVINIMDNDINMFVLKPNQYLVLNKTDYTVKTINNGE